MANALQKAWNLCVMALVRPYTRRELPGWGRLYQALVGGFDHNARWAGLGQVWVRGKLHGYEMPIDLASWSNRQTYFLGRYYDSQNQLAIKALVGPGDTVADIGGNEGMISLMAAHMVGPQGKVITFEPNPGPRARMEQSLRRNKIDWVDLRPLGLSDEPAILTLSIPRVNSGEGTFGQSAYEAEDTTTIEVPVSVGDRELAEETPRFIKIDVEGFELHVLRGLRETLVRAKPIVTIEIISQHLAHAGTTASEVAAELLSAGYRGWKMGYSGRGATLRVTLQPVESFADDVWADFLWVHPEDPLFDQVERRLARTGLS
ncbi:MAG TPA: FkbM family methyltransferase [Sphingobium sp.]|nr:FkbM family methyltransferase [Sphingobium sp.]